MRKQTIAPLLSVIGILFFLASAFDMLPSTTATFLGVAFFVLAGATWAFWPEKKEV